MPLYAMSDPHLSLTAEKPMDVFGGKWHGYVEKMKTAFEKLNDDDTVVMAGDISWAMKLDDAREDFCFLNELPAKKIFGKGNHDYWWNTASKLNAFVKENGFNKISFLYNNAYAVEDKAVCGSRGWYLDAEVEGCDNKKIIARECVRLDMSIKAGEQLALGTPIVFMHYPPLYGTYKCDEIIDVLKAHNIKQCFYGHLHGIEESKLIDRYENISFTLCSADYLNFSPLLIK